MKSESLLLKSVSIWRRRVNPVRTFTYVQKQISYVHIVVAGEDVDLKLLEPTVRFGFSPKAERKKENRQPKRGMGGRHAATTQGCPQSIRPTFTECLSF